MTNRQKEFCRHYLTGKTAKEAAHAAGYAQVTAERNAARMLKSAQVMRRITRLREARGIITRDHFERALKRVMHVLDYVHDDKSVMAANRQFVHLVNIQHKIQIDEQLLDEKEEKEQSQESISPASPVGKSSLQLLDLHGKALFSPGEEKDQDEIEKADLLPSGEPAFDLKLTPMKREYAKPTKNLKVVFRQLPPHASPPH